MPGHPSQLKQKRSRKRKARTEVSSSSETDSSDGEREQVKKIVKERREKKDKKTKKPTTIAVADASTQKTTPTSHISPPPPISTTQTTAPQPASSPSPPAQTTTTATATKTVPPSDPTNPDDAFSALFLRKLTAELGDDLDKVREAKDFTDRSLPMLVLALKQGERLFSREEKSRFVWADEEGERMEL